MRLHNIKSAGRYPGVPHWNDATATAMGWDPHRGRNLEGYLADQWVQENGRTLGLWRHSLASGDADSAIIHVFEHDVQRSYGYTREDVEREANRFRISIHNWYSWSIWDEHFIDPTLDTEF